MIDLGITMAAGLDSLVGLAPVLAQAEPDFTKLAKNIELGQLFNLTKVFTAALLIALGFGLTKLINSSLERLGASQAKRRLLFKKVASVARLTIFLGTTYLVTITVFDSDENRAVLFALMGTLGFGVGFALKDTIGSLMAGILILIDQPFQVGDRVMFGSTYGEVTEIGLRTVRIATLDDNAVSIPNNKFLTEAVASSNAGALDMMVVIKFYIAMTEDFELAKRIVYEACITSKYVFLSKPVEVHIKDEVTSIAFSTTVILKAYVIDCRYETAFVTDITERVKRSFRENKINYPYAREYSVRSTEWDDFAHEHDTTLLGRQPQER